MKKYFILMTIALIGAVAVSCQKEKPEDPHVVLPTPTGVKAPEEEIGSYSFTLIWDAVNNKDLASYTVSYKEASASEWLEIECYAMKAEIKGLEMKHTYNARVRANSSAGEKFNSVWSNTVSVTTIQAIDVDVPTGLKSTGATSSTISVEWDAMANAKGYVVSCRAEGATPALKEASENKAVIENLAPGTAYKISVKTCSKSGEEYDSDYCSEIEVSTLAKSYGITSTEDFVELLGILKEDPTGGEFKDEEGIINLRADLDLTSVTIDETTIFSGKLEGNDYKISKLNISGNKYVGLFPVIVNGSVKNLTIDESCSFTINSVGQTDTTFAGSLAGQIRGTGVISKITNKAAVKGGIYSGGIFGQFISDGTSVLEVEYCENYGNISMPKGQNAAKNVFVAGIAGGSEGIDGVEAVLSTIKNCKNYGTIENVSDGTAVLYQSIAGICCQPSDCYIENCSNEGTIKLAPATANGLWIGGISAKAYRSSLINCSNSGTLEFSAPASGNRELNAGGIIGLCGGNPKLPVQVKGCTNTSNMNIDCPEDMNAKPARVGGVIGCANALGLEVSNCTNSGKIEGSVYGANSGFAGIIGWIECKTAAEAFGSEIGVIKECVNTGEVYMKSTTTNWTQTGGVVGEIKTAFTPITGCRNEGKVTVIRTNRANAGGIVCESNASIYNCVNTGNVIGGQDHNDYYCNLAGIVARLTSAEKTNNVVDGCTNSGNVIFLGQGLSKDNLGEGIIGQGGIGAWLEYGSIQNCENTGTILDGTSTSYVHACGSICGWGGIKSASEIKDCRVGGAYGIADPTAADYGVSAATALTAETFSDHIFGQPGSKGTTATGCTFKAK